ncbi:uncharacterized protein LOC135491005 [Lineus longissimus]|uniref:uncharacterized protein LOC135491005 n=1 Tax=Lineus longissimus TaxID=88925 RepID=UPI002B4CC495
MEISPIVTSLFYVFVLLSSVILETLPCPGKHFPRSLAERVVSSDVIFWGEIVSKMVDHQRSDGTDVAYSAEVRVHCVLKGRVRSRIIVDDIGKVSGKCKAIDFIENEQYIMLLRVDRQGRYVPTFDQEMYSQGELDRIYGYCGINISQPAEEAEKESSYVDCPNIPSRRVINKKEANRCTPVDRVQRWEHSGPQPQPRVTIIPVINARTRELERPTRRPGRRRKGKGRDQQDDDMDVGRQDREQAGTPADSSKATGKRRYPVYPTQSVVAIIYERREPRSHASTISPQMITNLLTISSLVLFYLRGF